MTRWIAWTAALFLMGCGGCADRADVDDMGGTPLVNNSTPDASAGDDAAASGDQGTRDSCEGAALGASCDQEGVTCDYSCDGVCGLCSGIQCSAGTWSEIEDAPHLFCARDCHPVDNPCVDPAYPSCQWIEDLGDFRCLPAGERTAGEPCETDPLDESATSGCALQGTVCVDDPQIGSTCARICTPGDQSAVNCPYGCKPASDFGIDDPDLGFCVVPTGQVCVDDAPATVAGSCDIFAQDCPDGTMCQIVIVGGTNPFVFQTSCRPIDSDETQGEKQACDSTQQADCAPGLKCYEPTGTCLFVCRLSDGLGCTAGEFCSNAISDDVGLGFCTTACN